MASSMNRVTWLPRRTLPPNCDRGEVRARRWYHCAVAPPLNIDPERFFALTAALSLACSPAAPAAKAAGDGQNEPLDTTEGDAPAVAAVEVEAPPEPTALGQEADAPAKSREKSPDACNAEGEVSCHWIDDRYSAREGCRGICEGLKHGSFKPKAAAAIAQCFEREGLRACDIFVRRRCIREGLQQSCADPQFESDCQDAIARCDQEGKRPDFSVGECVKTLSGLQGGDLDWARGALGPSYEGCKLMFPVY